MTDIEKKDGTDRMFSIVIPVYNAELFLAETLNSILAQTFSDYEIILVDDGSTDGSGVLCDRFENEHDNIRVVHQSNSGQILSRKRGIAEASGRYICFVDADDLTAPRMLERVNRVICDTKCDLVLFDYSRIDANGKETGTGHAASFPGGVVRRETVFKEMLTSERLNPVWMKCVSRRLIGFEAEADTLKSVRNGEDLLQSIPLIEHAEKIYYLREPLYMYRMNMNSYSNNYHPGQHISLNVVRPELFRAVERLGLDTSENMRAFFGRYMENIVKNLKMISNSDIPREEKQRYYKEISEYEFVERTKKYLPTAGRPYDKAVFFFFSRRLWRVMELLLRIRRRGGRG